MQGQSALRPSGDSVVITGMCAVGRWLDAVIRAAIAHAPDQVELVLGDGSDKPGDLGRSDHASRIMAVSGASRDVLDVATTGLTRTVVAVDDPIDSVRFEQACRNWSFFHTLREQTRYAAGLMLLRNRDRVLIVRRGSETSARTLIATVVSHLRIPLDDAQLDAVQAQFGGSPSQSMTLEDALAMLGEPYVPLASLGSLVSDEEAGIIREALSPLVDGAFGEEFGPVVWRRAVFVNSETATEGLPDTIDATGAARILFYGPYFHLPPGRYHISAVVAFSKHLSGEAFALRAICGTRTICRLALRPTEDGLFSFNFTIDHDEPETRLEIQFMNVSGLIDGQLGIHHVTLVRSADPTG